MKFLEFKIGISDVLLRDTNDETYFASIPTLVTRSTSSPRSSTQSLIAKKRIAQHFPAMASNLKNSVRCKNKGASKKQRYFVNLVMFFYVSRETIIVLKNITEDSYEVSNGDRTSRKISKSSRTASSTPARSLSRGSKSPSLKSPDSNATTPGSLSEKKKVPMNKIQVGAAPSPNLKVVKSKIGSLANASYKPGGGNVKIETKKLEFKATPRIEAKNDKYQPKGGEKKIVQQKLQWNAKSKIGSLENAHHKPKGGDKKIESMKLDFKEKAKPKVGSKDNIKYQPGGGDVKIETKKIELNVSSKVGSMDNVRHKPGGGDKKIFDDKEYLKQMSAVSSIEHSLSGSQQQKGDQAKEEFSRRRIHSARSLDVVPEVQKFTSGTFSRTNSLRRKRNGDNVKPRWRY
nr:unnamed protein product [Callosobruchus analis]